MRLDCPVSGNAPRHPPACGDGDGGEAPHPGGVSAVAGTGGGQGHCRGQCPLRSRRAEPDRGQRKGLVTALIRRGRCGGSTASTTRDGIVQVLLAADLRRGWPRGDRRGELALLRPGSSGGVPVKFDVHATAGAVAGVDGDGELELVAAPSTTGGRGLGRWPAQMAAQHDLRPWSLRRRYIGRRQ